MQKIFRLFMASRRRRRRIAGAALWLLRLLLDAERAELQRISDLLDSIEPDASRGGTWREYAAAEDESVSCEYALGFLECAVEDIHYAY